MSDVATDIPENDPKKVELLEHAKAIVARLKEAPENVFTQDLQMLKRDDAPMYEIVKELLAGHDVVVTAPQAPTTETNLQEHAEHAAKQIYIMQPLARDIYMSALKEDEPKLHDAVQAELKKLNQTTDQKSDAQDPLIRDTNGQLHSIRIDSVEGMRLAVNTLLQFRAGQVSQNVVEMLLTVEIDRRTKLVYAAHQRGQVILTAITELQKRLANINKGIEEAMQVGKFELLETILKEAK